MKTCTKCLSTKESSSFKTRKSSKDGLHTWCVTCLAAYYAKHNKDNRDKRRAQEAERYEAGKEVILAKAKTYYAEHKPQIQNKKKKYRQENIEQIRQANSVWRDKNKDYLKVKKAAWQKANKGAVCAATAKRRSAVINATPYWADEVEIQKIYKTAEAMRLSGIDVHVDHVIPLQNDTVCGLHVHWNLQIINATKNRSKGNRIYQ